MNSFELFLIIMATLLAIGFSWLLLKRVMLKQRLNNLEDFALHHPCFKDNPQEFTEDFKQGILWTIKEIKR